MHQFNECHSVFKGFSKYYDEEIAPYQPPVKGYVWPYGWFGLTVSGVALFSSFLALLVLVFELPILLSVLIGAGLFVLGFIIYDINKYSYVKDIDYKSVLKIAFFAGFRLSGEPNQSYLLWRSLGLVPYSKKGSVTPFSLLGEYKGINIELTHAKFYVTNERAGHAHSAARLAFDGHLIQIDMPKAFSAITVVTRDQGIGQAKTHNTLKKVGLVDPVFERIFEVYGSDQVETRALLSPDLMQEIVNLERVTQGKSIEFGFIAGKLLIKLSEPILEMREGLENGQHNINVTQNLIDEIGCVFDIMDIIIR